MMRGLRIKSENDIIIAGGLFCGDIAGVRHRLGCQTFLCECIDWQMCSSLYSQFLEQCLAKMVCSK